MAAIYQRNNKWWIKLTHPQTGEKIRQSLGTQDEARAQLLCRRAELEAALLEPEMQIADLPDSLYRALGTSIPSLSNASSEPKPQPTNSAPIVAVPESTMTRTLVNDAFRDYLQHCLEENSAHHVQGKVSMLRRYLGTKRAAKLIPKEAQSTREYQRPADHPSFFKGTYLDEISSSQLKKFMDYLGVASATKRKYREMFHHFFEYCIKYGLYEPSNFHCPNPVAALPSYLSRNQRIEFLNEEQVEEQLEALRPYPRLYLATAILIYAGLRRGEMIWLTKDSISSDLSFLTIVNKVDDKSQVESSLKTGSRPDTMLPKLKKILQEHLPRLESKWLVPREDGKRWTGNSFSHTLKRVNQKAGLKWTAMHYRHTFATMRAAEGWPLFRIAQEMGNSSQIVEQHYAAYFRPGGSTSNSTEQGEEGKQLDLLG